MKTFMKTLLDMQYYAFISWVIRTLIKYENPHYPKRLFPYCPRSSEAIAYINRHWPIVTGVNPQ